MNHIQTWLAVIGFLICTSAFADITGADKAFRDCPICPEMVIIPAGSFDMGWNDPFEGVIRMYRTANPKPKIPEDAHKFKVQAEFAVQENQLEKAADLYGKALNVAPWWPEGHFNRALILAETKHYWEATREMKRYVLLVPDAPDTHAAQDKIYQWEVVAEPEAEQNLDEKPVHRVIISHPFAIGRTEVTQGQWKAIMGNNPSKFQSCGDLCPVDNVSWDDANEFIQKLNNKTVKKYRLPSEAEWEYACRAGEKQEYCGSDRVGSVAWHGNNRQEGVDSDNTSHSVATKVANAWGLYDMSGNVWEWVEDSYHGAYINAPTDGSVWPEGGQFRILRGGSWNDDAHSARASERYSMEPSGRFDNVGFRLAKTLP